RMSIDLKKYRFRVHRGTLHALGDPTQVQLMFDPEKKAIMLVAPSEKAPFGQEEKVVFDKPGHDGCFQLYSMSLIQKIQNIFPDLEDQTTYGLNGKLIPSLHAVYFPLSSLSRIESNEAKSNGTENHDRQRIQEPDTASEG
ncbi:MAG: hypothetical protein IJ828_07170, partial [Treponema sp.]|nr:hypothetical protein [Treponema sp.]